MKYATLEDLQDAINDIDLSDIQDFKDELKEFRNELKEIQKKLKNKGD